MEPKVAIVVLNWNSYDESKKCISSLANLDYANIEVYLVDNCSTDGSLELLMREFPNVNFINNPRNFGFAGGVNRGIEYVIDHVDYVWLLNSDAYVDVDAGNALSELVVSMESDSGLGIAGSVIVTENDTIWFSGGTVISPYIKGRHYTDRIVGDRRYCDYVTGCSMLIRAPLAQRIGLLYEGYFLYYEDADYCNMASEAGYQCAVISGSVIRHKVGASSKKNPELNYVYYNFRNRFIYSRRWSKPHTHLYFVIMASVEMILRTIRFSILRRHRAARLLVKAFKDGITGRVGRLEES